MRHPSYGPVLTLALATVAAAAACGQAGATPPSPAHTHRAADVTYDDAKTRLGARDVQAAIAALQAQVAALRKRVADLAARPAADCPAGYTRDATERTFTLCKRGSDEMVRAGDAWVDRYEMVIVDAAFWNGGRCDRKGATRGRRYGDATDDYPATFPDTGHWTARLYACSSAGPRPSAAMTWFQAAQACAAAGKHLCTNAEWQVASAGTPSDTAACLQPGPTPPLANGARPGCQSSWGARNMGASLFEWVALWTQAGLPPNDRKEPTGTPWPAGYGGDRTWGVYGSAFTGAGEVSYVPAAVRRSGHWGNGTEAGPFVFNTTDAPSTWRRQTGARCCRR